jgi:sortase (surface protein transpeptidase)
MLLGGQLLLGISVLAALLSGCNSGSNNLSDVSIENAPTISPAVQATSPKSPPAAPTNASPSATVTPAVTPTPDLVVRSLKQLRAEHGESPDATHGRLRIPALGIDAPLGIRTVGKDGVLTNPTGPDDVVWYDLSIWDGLGGSPGEGGNAIFAGHVDQTAWLDWASVQYAGLGVFFFLDNLTPGQQITIEMNDHTHIYVVQWIRSLETESDEWAEIYGPDHSGNDAITLITCGGDYDAEEKSYALRIVVRAIAS